MPKTGRLVLTLLSVLALALLVFLPWSGFTGEYHVGDTLLCYDCHTMHFSQTQGYSPTQPFGPGSSIQFPMTTGPNPYLLNQPQNDICLSCHDSKDSAPDVLGDNYNTPPDDGREAGALNKVGLGGSYQTWKGHTLYSTDVPPGYNPSLIGFSNWYNGTTYGLKCIHCHEYHGSPAPYRNLNPSALSPISASISPTYVVSMTNDTTKDVWIKLASYTAGGGAAAFNPYYATRNISFNRNDATVGATKTSNRLDTFCASCHGNFHGGPGDANIGASPSSFDGFIRHPTSQTTIGTTGSGHSTLSRYTGATTKVKVYASDTTGYTDATPGCITCHKGHGNKNPFGLIFLSRNAASVSEEGGYATGQTEAANGYQVGYRNLCGQCHGQGN